MKKLSWFIVSSLLLQSFAWAGPKESLKSILDEYQYAVTVEWDQKDKAQLDAYKTQFNAELNKLIVEENLSVKDVSDFIQENSQALNLDEQSLELLKDHNGQLNLARTQELLEQNSTQIYSQGSSWAPEKLLLYGVLTLLVIEIVVSIVTNREDVCPNPASHPNNVPYACVYE